MNQTKIVTPYTAAGAVDSVVRKLAFVPGMTREDKQAIIRLRLLLRDMRKRHEPQLDVSNLPEDVARCLTGPARPVRYLTSRAARGRV